MTGQLAPSLDDIFLDSGFDDDLEAAQTLAEVSTPQPSLSSFSDTTSSTSHKRMRPARNHSQQVKSRSIMPSSSTINSSKHHSNSQALTRVSPNYPRYQFATFLNNDISSKNDSSFGYFFPPSSPPLHIEAKPTSHSESKASTGGKSLSKKRTQSKRLSMKPSSNSSSHRMKSTESLAAPEDQDDVLDITHLLNMPQKGAADRLGLPVSTFSKKWKAATNGRKWPFRMISKLDKEILTLMHNIPDNQPTEEMPPHIAKELGRLLRERQNLIVPVRIRVSLKSGFQTPPPIEDAVPRIRSKD